jgi:hypothetical protein
VSPPPALAASSYAGPILILIVNRQPRDAKAEGPSTVSVRIRTQALESAPSFSEHVNVLADGASGQDCSALVHDPGVSRPYIFGMALEPLLGAVPQPIEGTVGLGSADEAVAHALAQACGDSIESTFERWVRQEPGPVHP